MTAKEWREQNPKLADKGNIRDYASNIELAILSNLEFHNSLLLRFKASLPVLCIF